MPDKNSSYASDETTESLDHQQIVNEWNLRISRTKDDRTLWEAWLATTMGFAEGRQRVWYDPDTGERREKVLQKGEIFRCINLFDPALSVIASRLTVDSPQWSPKPGQLKSVTRQEVLAAQAALSEAYNEHSDEDFSMREKFKLCIRNGFLQGGGMAYIYFDETTGYSSIAPLDFFDVYSDPGSQLLSQKMWLTFCLPKGVEWLKANYKNADGIEEDNMISESGIKAIFMRDTTGHNRKNIGTVMTRFCFEVKDGKIEHTIIAGNRVLHQDTLDHTSLAEIFDCYRPTVTTRFHSRPLALSWVEPQKTFNHIYSSIENYISTFGVGKWRTSSDKVDIPVGGVHGQIIQAMEGELESIPMDALPSSHFNMLQVAQSQFEQVTGVHGESYGSTDGQNQSGKAIATAQAFDEQNSADHVDNYKLFLRRVGIKMLNQMSANWDKVHTLYRYDKRTGESLPMDVMGEDYVKNDKATKLRKFKDLEVEMVVGSWFSKSRKLEILQQAIGAGWQPSANPVVDRIIFDSLDIGIGSEVVTALEQLENPYNLIVTGNAALLASGEEVVINQNDPHEMYSGVYEQKAKEAMELGDQKAAEALSKQARRHKAMMQGSVMNTDVMPREGVMSPLSASPVMPAPLEAPGWATVGPES